MVREAMYWLIVKQYGDLETAAARFGYPYKTFWRTFTLPGPKERNKTITLDVIMELYARMAEDKPGLPSVVDFLAEALSQKKP